MNKTRRSLYYKQYREKNLKNEKKRLRKYYRKNNKKIKQQTLTWRKNNPDRAKTLSLFHNLKKYQLTIEQYHKLLADQNGVCAICGLSQTNGKRLFVDHCHKTGKVRELLCTRCNTLLGMAKDDENILISACNYCKKWNSSI